MSKSLLQSVIVGTIALVSSLSTTIPLANTSKVPETPKETIKKTRFVAGKTSKEYFGQLNNGNGYVTGIDRGYEAVEESCKTGNPNISVKDFCEQREGRYENS